MEWQFDFKRAPSMVVAWQAYEGDPKGVNGVFDAVRIWVAFKGITPTGPPLAVHQHPEGFDPKKLVRLEVWVPVPPGTKGDKQVQIKSVPLQKIAYTVHRGSLLLLPAARERLLQFLEEKRITHDKRAHREVYTRMDPPNPENPGWQVEMQVPVVEG